MFATTLRALRSKAGLSQAALAKKMYVSQQTIAKWELDKSTPNPEALTKLSEIFNVSLDTLVTGSMAKPSTRKGIKIPVLGRVQAGIPIEAMEEVLDWEEITPEMDATGDHFALRVLGRSMEPRICDGDVVIIRKQANVDNGDIAVVLVNGNEGTLKKIKRTEAGITLIPNNPVFDPMFYTNEEIMELPVVVIGKMVELRAKF